MSELNAHNVKYLIVGGYAVSFHSEPRTTRDLSLFIQPSPENAGAIFRAWSAFGAPLGDYTVENFLDPRNVIGMAPYRIDILQQIDGVDFDSAWQRRVRGRVASDDSLEARDISADDLVRNKLATGRPRDLADAAEIQALLRSTRPEQES
ncbi:MAG TPA: hypothetical protein VK593_06285 [Edaphobacter sp.]|nr:hypothetical protein [Edaphobacter sp.]